MDPQQELFTALKLGIEAKGYTVYDGVLPPDGTPYPFVYLGQFRQSDIELKNAVFGSVYPQIHVWHDSPKKRGTVSQMLFDIKTVLRSIERTGSFAWCVRSISQDILADNTTKTPLIHGVIDAEIKFS